MFRSIRLVLIVCCSTALLGGCTAAAFTATTAAIGAGASVYNMLNGTSKDLAQGFVTGCQHWAEEHGKTETLLQKCTDRSKADAIANYGRSACEQIAAGDTPPITPIANAVWLGTIAAQEHQEALQCQSIPSS